MTQERNFDFFGTFLKAMREYELEEKNRKAQEARDKLGYLGTSENTKVLPK